jgi:4-diphosphocytidyl-2-C-methyl-D-erythritol kinase
VLRAARRCSKRPAAPGRAHRIDKQIPAQAGMGGGSSDAATTLLALNRLWGWARAAQLAAGPALGADVPFFLWRQRLGRGIGESSTR